MQLLEHGADVHAHHAKTKQTPLRLALCDPEMDPKLIELLVYYGASPFLEAKDGMPHMTHVCSTWRYLQLTTFIFAMHGYSQYVLPGQMSTACTVFVSNASAW